MDDATQTPEPTEEATAPVAPTAELEAVPVEKPALPTQPFALPLPAEQKYMLMAMDAKHDKMLLALRGQLERKYAILMMEEYNRLLQVSGDIRVAREAYNAAINSVIASIEEKLPEGFAVVELKAEQGVAVVAHSPTQRGQQRFAV